MIKTNNQQLFKSRLAPWTDLGNPITDVDHVSQALHQTGLDWKVKGAPLYTSGSRVEGFQANIREYDGQVLGIVSDRYQIVQNQEAFSFTDDLLSEGLEFVSGGSYQNGQRVWLLAKMPKLYSLAGDDTSTFLLFLNSHDGSSSCKVAITPLRILCQNAINLALKQADRTWSFMHTRTAQYKLQNALSTLIQTEKYMQSLSGEIEALQLIRLTNNKADRYMRLLLPMPDGASNQQIRNIERLRNDLSLRYYKAPDLDGMDKNGWRFINALSDFTTHAEPLRRTDRYRENQLMKSVDGNPLVDKAVKMIRNAA